jgi:hypothetical protein
MNKPESQERVPMTEPKTIWAFWSYDLFPFLLSGLVKKRTVSEGHGRRLVYVQAYQGWFNPEFELEGEEGEKLHKELEALEVEYGKAKKDLEELYIMKRDKMISVGGKPRKKTT